MPDWMKLWPTYFRLFPEAVSGEGPEPAWTLPALVSLFSFPDAVYRTKAFASRPEKLP